MEYRGSEGQLVGSEVEETNERSGGWSGGGGGAPTKDFIISLKD